MILDDLKQELLDASTVNLGVRYLGWYSLEQVFADFARRHTLLHDCEEPYTCDICKESFPGCTYEGDTRRKIYHDVDGVPCDYDDLPVCPQCGGGDDT